MVPRLKPTQTTTVVLGAGASRGVKYAHLGEIPSPLDSDFFDLLQRLNPSKSDIEAREYVLNELRTLPNEYRRSMEKTFYTLQLRAYLAEKLADAPKKDEEVIRNFARCIQALLRKAHGTKRCGFHQEILARLHHQDTIISFNYDSVPERALIETAEARGVDFGDRLYGLELSLAFEDFPLILKLHGSSNWKVEGDNEFRGSRTKTWEDLDKQPGYLGFTGKGTVFPIFLPFWEKRIEEGMWRDLWRLAYFRLGKTRTLLVWGYSLPTTDVKAQQLFKLALGRLERLCVIDLARATRERWRELLPDAPYWEYDTAKDFLKYPPPWWA